MILLLFVVNGVMPRYIIPVYTFIECLEVKRNKWRHELFTNRTQYTHIQNVWSIITQNMSNPCGLSRHQVMIFRFVNTLELKLASLPSRKKRSEEENSVAEVQFVHIDHIGLAALSE